LEIASFNMSLNLICPGQRIVQPQQSGAERLFAAISMIIAHVSLRFWEK
jgi:hypothetical protein